MEKPHARPPIHSNALVQFAAFVVRESSWSALHLEGVQKGQGREQAKKRKSEQDEVPSPKFSVELEGSQASSCWCQDWKRLRDESLLL